MRIDAYHQVAQIYNTDRFTKAKDTVKVGGRRDEVQISSFGRDYKVAKQALADVPDVREDRVAQIKARVDSGAYDVDINDFANKLVKKYNALK